MAKYMAQKPAFVTTGHAAVSNAIAAGEKLATFELDLDHAAAQGAGQTH